MMSADTIFMEICRWDVDEALPAAQAQPRVSADLQRLKQQSSGNHTFLAGTSTHARTRQAQDRRRSPPKVDLLLPTLCHECAIKLNVQSSICAWQIGICSTGTALASKAASQSMGHLLACLLSEMHHLDLCAVGMTCTCGLQPCNLSKTKPQHTPPGSCLWSSQLSSQTAATYSQKMLRGMWSCGTWPLVLLRSALARYASDLPLGSLRSANFLDDTPVNDTLTCRTRGTTISNHSCS